MFKAIDGSLNDNLPASTVEFLSAVFGSLTATVVLLLLPPKNQTGSGVKGLAKRITTTIDRLKDDPILQEKLRASNKERGIYYIVNSGGTKVKQINLFNAFFVEFDDWSKEEQLERVKGAPIQPSAIVRAKRGHHIYWFIIGECSAKDHKDTHERLIDYFDSDPAIKNPNRAMRLPGFNHVSVGADGSRHYQLVECVHLDPSLRHTVQQMRDAFNDKAIAKAILSREWVERKRHHLAMYVSGALAHAGYLRDEADEIITEVCKRRGDEEIEDRRHAVQDSYNKFENQEEVGGWKKIEEEGLLEPRVIERLQKRLGRKSKPKKKTKPSVADVVREILSGLDLIRLESKEVFVTYPSITGKRTCAIDSEEFSTWVRDYFFDHYDHILDSGTLKNILPIFARNARLTDQQVFLRVAHQEGTTYIDLNNAEQEVVEITAEGWEVKKL